MVRNDEFISVLNVSKFPPLVTDFTKYSIPYKTYQPGEYGNNSMCSMMAQNQPVANDLIFITKRESNILRSESGAFSQTL